MPNVEFPSKAHKRYGFIMIENVGASLALWRTNNDRAQPH